MGIAYVAYLDAARGISSSNDLQTIYVSCKLLVTEIDGFPSENVNPIYKTNPIEECHTIYIRTYFEQLPIETGFRNGCICARRLGAGSFDVARLRRCCRFCTILGVTAD